MKSIRKMLRSPFHVVFLVVLIWFLLTFLILPAVETLTTVFFTDGHLSTRAFHRLTSSSKAVRGLLNSFMLGIVLSITVNIVGILMF